MAGKDSTIDLNSIRTSVSFVLSCSQRLTVPNNCETATTKEDLSRRVIKGRARKWSEDDKKLDIWSRYWAGFPSGSPLCLPLWVLIAERRMWLTDLKGNYWRGSLSMPLTDNQLIIVLIIYSSPLRPLSILLAVSLRHSAETFNGLAGSPLCRGAVKTSMLALASLHFLHSTGPQPHLSTLPGKRKN